VSLQKRTEAATIESNLVAFLVCFHHHKKVPSYLCTLHAFPLHAIGTEKTGGGKYGLGLICHRRLMDAQAAPELQKQAVGAPAGPANYGHP